MNLPTLDWQQWALIAAAVVLVAAGVLYWALRRRPTPDEIERRRRAHINQIGRIAEGRVVEILEAPPELMESPGVFSKKKAAPAPANGSRKLVHYSYSVSGVSYSTAQDVTDLQARAALHLLVAGQPASVKYDPANPGNSILLADDWSGVR